jgi:hypothetical protein
LLLLALACGASAQSFTLSGYVRDSASGEALVGATVVVQDAKRGAYTNNYGFFSLTLPAGDYRFVSSYVGYRPDTTPISLDRNRLIEVRLAEKTKTVAEVVISASQGAYAREVQSPQMSQINLKIRDIKLIPVLGGEADVMKVLQLMPGVTKGAEGTTSILVRGGDPDQNLILLDEAVVYNVSHLFGFFSVFNPDALKDLNLYKGGFPSQYGGRLSSVIDITMTEGNQQKFHVKGGIGLLSSRLTVEGPIIRDRASFSISGRRTYLDKVLALVGLSVPYYFYDLNAKANYKIDDRNRLYLSGYLGDDVLYTPQGLQPDDSLGVGNVDFGFRLGNQTLTLRWNHLFSERLFSNTSLIYTRFKYDINGEVGENSIFIGSDVTDLGVKYDMGYYADPENTFKMGGQVINHRFRPNVLSAQGDISQFVQEREGNLIQTQEWALYGSHEWQPREKLHLNYGLRASGVFVRERAYAALEPRASLAWVLNDKNSFKLGYSRMKQYMHLVSSSTVALPTDLWYPVTRTVKPQRADQVAASYTRHFEAIGSLLTVETYYKWMNNLTEYREGANLILNDNFEQELLQGRGWSYGLELLLKRDEGRLNGWLAYTLAFSRRQFDGLNNGQAYWAKYDRRHDVSAVAIFKISDRLSVSGVYSYLSGARFTPQIGQYIVPNPSLTGVEYIPIYTERNAVRLTAARRVDLSLILANKPRKKFRTDWNFSCYNLLNAPTPIRVNINYDVSRGWYYTQPSFLGRVLSIAWNFEF